MRSSKASMGETARVPRRRPGRRRRGSAPGGRPDVAAGHADAGLGGVGKILALGLLYEIHDIRRFAGAGEFLSYARLIRPLKTSAGKVKGGGGAKIGNAHLKWAFSEAACLLVRESDQAKRFLARQEKKHGTFESRV